MSGLHIATAMHYRCLSLKQGLHSTPISLGTPVRNLDSLFLIFFPRKKKLGVVQVALLITFALPKKLWQSSHFLLRTRKKSPRDYMGLGYVNTENQKPTAPTGGAKIVQGGVMLVLLVVVT